jgi:hypothetical protein
MLTEFCGYTIKESEKAKTNSKTTEPGREDTKTTQWSSFNELIDHDKLTAMAMKLARSGMDIRAAHNLLRTQVEAIEPHDAETAERKERRLKELKAIVDSGYAKAAVLRGQEERERLEQQQQQQGRQNAGGTPPSEQDGNAHGYSWHLIAHGELDLRTGEKELVEGLLPEIGTALLSGQWGVYKTFIALDLAASVMAGAQFARQKVKRKGGVLWLACEGQTEIPKRLEAAWKERGGSGQAPFFWTKTAPALLGDHAEEILTQMAQQAAKLMQERFNLPLVLIVIDTLGKAAKAQKDGSLNDDVPVKKLMGVLSGTSMTTGALSVGVTHFGKILSAGTKNSTSFEDDADCILAVLGDKELVGTVSNSRMCIRKSRSGETGREFPFQVRKVELDTDYVQTDTLVLDWFSEDYSSSSSSGHSRENTDPWSATKPLRLLRRIIQDLLAKGLGTQLTPPLVDKPVIALNREDIRHEFFTRYPVDTEDEKRKQATKQKSYRRCESDGRAKGLIEVRDINETSYLWIT